MKVYKVSLVICTHRRVDLLRMAIDSLVNQKSSPDDYEVIIVDNDVRENNSILEIASEAGKILNVRYIHESMLGLSHARNTGGKAAQSDYICYLDDDVRVNPHYTDSLINLIETINPDICGGPYFPFYLNEKPLWYKDIYGSMTHGDSPRFLNSNEYLSGGNIVFRRDSLIELGWFSQQYGMSGKKLWYGEETALIIRARKLNPDIKIYYDPDIAVKHLVAEWKMRIWGNIKISFKRGRSHAYFWINQQEVKKNKLKYLKYYMMNVLELIISILKMIKRDRKRFPLWQNYFMEIITRKLQSLGMYYQVEYDALFSLSIKTK